MDLELGAKIKEVRKEKNRSIASLSKECGVSEGMISQIERGKVIPSALILWKITQALGKSVSYFFGEENLQEQVVVCLNGQHKRISRSGGNGYFDLLSPKGNRQIEMIRIVLDPGEDEDQSPITHRGEECGVVIAGNMVVEVNGKAYFLDTGDSIHFDSTLPHRYYNTSNERCISIWSQQPYTW